MRHTLRITALATLVAASLAACGSGESSSGEATGTSTAAGGSGFPVTITHALGKAEIPAAPKRVVTLGMGSAETAIALGVTPVGTERYDWGADKSGQLPWVAEAVKEQGGTAPELITGANELDIEKVLELEPDVIIAPWSGVTAEQYKQLSEIAPTVAYAKQPWTVEWDEQIRTVGKALGKSAEAEQEIKDLDALFTKTANAHPDWAGKSFVYAYNTGPGTLGVFLPAEQRAAFVEKLGLTTDPVVSTFKEEPGTMSAVIGLENASKLKDADLFFTFYMDEASRTKIEAQPLYAAIPAVKRGSVVTSADTSLVTATSEINPLTVPWVMDRYAALIDAAVAKVG
ncbi:MAG: iron-siderophore ABC transporter substrate-binding protein [Micrococcales bacterium]|nr:iron-siderophore ABC transporter substrate-binding protein [Micrococcales bacterium]